MKKLFLSLSLVTALAVSSTSFVGCTTSATGVKTISPAAISAITVAAELGTQIALSKDPSLKAAMTIGSQTILALASQGNYEPSALAAALNAKAGTGLDAQTSILIADVVTLYNGAFQQIVADKLDPNQVAKPLLIGIATGIQQGITAGPIVLVPPSKDAEDGKDAIWKLQPGSMLCRSQPIMFDLDPGFSLSNIKLAAYFSKLVYSCIPTISGKNTDTKVLIQKCGNALVVVFQGTRDVAQFILDAKFWHKKDAVFQSTHYGFGIAYRDVADKIRQAVLHDDTTSPIFIFGHSLGGALATLCAYDLGIRGFSSRIQQVITFGSPRVGNRSFSQMYNAMIGKKTFRFVRQADAVTMMPWLGFFHVDNEFYIDNNNFLEFNPGFWSHLFSDIPVIISQLLHGRLAALEDHYIDGDMKALEEFTEETTLFSVQEKVRLLMNTAA